MFKRILFWLGRACRRLVRLFYKELRLVEGVDLATNFVREVQSFFVAGARTLAIKRWPSLALAKHLRLRYDHCFSADGSPRVLTSLATVGQGLLGSLMGYQCPSPLTFSIDIS